MNIMKFTGKAVALCFAAGIAAAALSACGDKKTEEPAQNGAGGHRADEIGREIEPCPGKAGNVCQQSGQDEHGSRQGDQAILPFRFRKIWGKVHINSAFS